MSKHKGCKRQFTQMSRSWYAEACKREGVTDEIMIGHYHPDGGTTGEFTIKWVILGGKPEARLEVFSDAWDSFSRFQSFQGMLADMDGTNPTPQEICDALKKCGVEDVTQETR